MKKAKKLIQSGNRAFLISGGLVILITLVTVLEFTLCPALQKLGIVPRTKVGLIGIVVSPLLHGSVAHLLANLPPLFILSVILFWDVKYKPPQALGFIWFLSGFGTWLIGRPAIHLGASSIIYGLAAYLIAAGFWMRRWRPIVVALLVAVFYGGIFYGIFPHDPQISWEAHLSGAVAGFGVAKALQG